MPDGIVYADSPGSRGKLDAGGFTRCRINRSKEFADRRNHINGIGDFGIRQNAPCENTTESIVNLSRRC
ncbi:IS1016 transposase [Neisseria gonorrhoeae]|uniref:IS1016 transposase n=1 Tax=Neisseria gonorrhoeae TaxID=485 RepID=A0A378W1K1_NEIGO|nr:IS1016 transposase [Neisseria gonorrhoeae]